MYINYSGALNKIIFHSTTIYSVASIATTTQASKVLRRYLRTPCGLDCLSVTRGTWSESDVECVRLCGETETGGLDVWDDLVAAGVEGSFDVEGPEQANDTDPDRLGGEILTGACASAETETVVTLVECLCSELLAVLGHEPLWLEGGGFRVKFFVVVDGPDVRDNVGVSRDSVTLVEVLLEALVRC